MASKGKAQAQDVDATMEDPRSLQPFERNPRQIADDNYRRLLASVREFGLAAPIVANRTTGRVVGGHQRLRAALELGMPAVPVRWVELSPEKEASLNVALNNPLLAGTFDDAALEELLRELDSDLVELAGMEMPDFSGDDAGISVDPEAARATLAERFIVPPFSVLDARQGYWQERKRAWLALGIKSELGRSAPIGGGAMPLDRAGRSGRVGKVSV